MKNLSVIMLFILSACVDKHTQQAVNCTDSQIIADKALSAYMVSQGYMFSGGC